jgi:hypothetical protein
MGQEEKDSGLTPRKVALMLKIGADPSEAEPVAPEMAKAELLRDRLAGRLPSEGLARRQLLASLEDFRQIVMQSEGPSMGQCLLAHDTPLKVLRRIKEHGAALSRSALSDIEHETANVIYYGAIASALIFHRKRITQFKRDDLQGAFAALAVLSWLPPSLAEHFRQAVQSCAGLGERAEGSADE